MIKIKTLVSETQVVVFFSFECLGTLLLPCHLLSNINNTIPTKFKLFYEMLTNFILVLLSFILYYLYSFIFFFQNPDLNDMVFGRELRELGDIPPVRCVSAWNGYLWSASNRSFFF